MNVLEGFEKDKKKPDHGRRLPVLVRMRTVLHLRAGRRGSRVCHAVILGSGKNDIDIVYRAIGLYILDSFVKSWQPKPGKGSGEGAAGLTRHSVLRDKLPLLGHIVSTSTVYAYGPRAL